MKIVFLLFLALTAADKDRAVAAYRALPPAEIEAHRTAALPKGVEFARIDVSERMRSASFGHTTTLLVAPDVRTFYVEYGRSTNRPQVSFGPFAIR